MLLMEKLKADDTPAVNRSDAVTLDVNGSRLHEINDATFYIRYQILV